MSDGDGGGRDPYETGEWKERPLGLLLRQARSEAGLTQSKLAERVGKSEVQVRAVERGDRLPSLELLTTMAAVLVPDRDSRVTVLARWLAKLVDHRASAAAPAGDLTVASAALVDALAPAQRELPPLFPRSLAGFPEQFQPLVAVFPDRRELPPDSPADLFIRSGAVTDYQFLGLLQKMDTPLTICSDKLFVLKPADWLAERFSNAHLLVVGSSAVNWLTRAIAGTALFRPLIDPDARAWNDRYWALKSQLDDHKMLNVFWQLLATANGAQENEVDVSGVPTHELAVEEVELLGPAADLARQVLEGRTEAAVVQQFRVSGFADPASGQQQGQPAGARTDFGVVTLAPHPFDTTGRFVSILCAGIAGPGTALGLRALLAEHDRFAANPFGGVIKVVLPSGQETWPGRYEDAIWKWQTQPYQPADILGSLNGALGADRARRSPAFRRWTDDELKQAIFFVEQLIGPAGH
jgi:transcriptional regulator with XRE-family HTH domain